MAIELTTVADDEAVIHDGPVATRWEDLDADTEYRFDGVEFTTLPRRGDLLARIATVNDVHFGERVAGSIEGSTSFETFSVEADELPYPELMNGGAVADIAATSADLVVAKGDLTSSGTIEEYQRFLEVYGTAFGDRLLHVRGNHESFHHLDVASSPTQERQVPGAVVALLDTSRDGRVNGDLDPSQMDWLDELGARADRPVLVMGHHPVWNPAEDPRRDSFFGLVPEATESLAAVFGRRPSLLGYFAGHTHRNRVIHLPDCGDRPFTEVACVKDFPGSWAEYRVYDDLVLQIHRRISTPAALAWTERTRAMYAGTYADYAFGSLSDRCFAMWAS